MKRIVSLFLCLLMVMSLVSVAAAEDRVTLTMMNRLPARYVVEGNPVIEALEDLLNVNLEIEAPPIRITFSEHFCFFRFLDLK